MTFQAPPMLTVVWPEVPWEDNGWILGWNPRGLVLVVAAFIVAPTVADAQAIVRTRLAGTNARSIPRNLRLIGRLRESNGASPGGNGGDIAADGGARAARSAADIWLELTPGPALAELYCCGYKHRAQLHVIRCDSKCRKFQTSPIGMSVLSNWGIAGLAALLAGGKPLLRPESESPVEGPVLAPHAAQLFAAKTVVAGSGGASAPNNSSDLYGQSSEDARDKDQTPLKSNNSLSGPSLDRSPGEQTSSSSSNDTGSYASDLLGPVAAQQGGSGGVGGPPAVLVATRPPRLSFPTAADKTELSDVFGCLNSGVLIRERLAKGGASAAAPAAPAAAPSPIIASLAAPLIAALLALQVVTALSNASYVGRVLDFRLRELVNWLSLVSGRSTSCGLQPLIPHVLDHTCPPSRRRLCIWGFVTRVLGDMLLGIAIVMLLKTCEAPLIALVRSVGWFGLYEVHMGYISWFVGWPAGFKMNDDLNVVLSFVTRSVLRTWRDTVTHEAMQSENVLHRIYTVWMVVSCCGASFSLAFVADCSNIATQHLRLAFRFMSLIYKCFQSLLSCLLLMFRGRKTNPLRKRVDAADFSVDQMLFGALLATATAFLFPTLAFYYFYLALVRMVIYLVQELLSAMSFVCCYLPIFPVLYWLTSRFALPNGVELSDPFYRAPPPSRSPTTAASPTTLSSPSAELPIIDVTLRIKPMPITEAFVDLFAVVWLVSRPFSLPRLMAFVLNADHKPLVVTASSDVFPHLAASSTNPPLTIKC